MKIRRINLKSGDYIRIGDFATECHETNEYLITEIREFSIVDSEGILTHGFHILNKDIQLAWIPYHVITAIFYEIKND